MIPQLPANVYEIQAPANRGKFSPDRDQWEQIHQRRYVPWQLGESVEDIAKQEGVTSNAIRHSIAWCEAQLSGSEVLANRNTRLRLQALAKLGAKFMATLEKLMSDPNPIIRLKAIEQFGKTVGLDKHAGVQVTVDQRSANVYAGGKMSFERAMDSVRERLRLEEAERERAKAIEAKDVADTAVDRGQD